LDEILGRIPEARRRLEDLEQRTSQRLIQHLQSVCAQWTVYARYSPEMATIQDADDFLDKVEELRKWLR
jgi:deoxyadenosine/deoxycytidine kinase